MTDETADWTQRLRTDSLAQLESIQRMQDEIAQVYGEAEAARGLVSVRVTPAGMPTSITLRPEAVHELDSEDIAAALMTAISEATAQAAEQLRAIVGQSIPTEQLDALMNGTVSEQDRRDVREQIDALRSEG